MTAPIITTTIDVLYAAILDALKATYGTRFATYAPYDPDTLLDPDPIIQTPALYLQFGTTDGGHTDRDRTAVDLSLVLHIVCSTGTDGLQVALDVLTHSVMVRILQLDSDGPLQNNTGTRWGLGLCVSPAADVLIDERDPGWNGYGMRRVQWRQTVYLPDDPIECLAEPAPAPVPEPDPVP